MREMIGYFVAIAFLMAGLACITWWSAGQEASAFERATGKHVSQWDALFLELRVGQD